MDQAIALVGWLTLADQSDNAGPGDDDRATDAGPQGTDRKMSSQIEGRCLCGAVRFVANGAPAAVAWCHCQSCRKHSGAPVSVFVVFRRDAWAMTAGEITRFNSSPDRLRGFCARCGSTLTCEGESSPDTHFHIGAFTFDDAARLAPTTQFFREERLPWFPSTDGTAPYPESS